MIELKPKNSRAISNGNQQVRYYRDELTRELEKMLKGESSRVMQDLISKRSDFAKCKRFEQRLRCYTLCPDVDSEGEFPRQLRNSERISGSSLGRARRMNNAISAFSTV